MEDRVTQEAIAMCSRLLEMLAEQEAELKVLRDHSLRQAQLIEVQRDLIAKLTNKSAFF